MNKVPLENSVKTHKSLPPLDDDITEFEKPQETQPVAAILPQISLPKIVQNESAIQDKDPVKKSSLTTPKSALEEDFLNKGTVISNTSIGGGGIKSTTSASSIVSDTISVESITIKTNTKVSSTPKIAAKDSLSGKLEPPKDSTNSPKTVKTNMKTTIKTNSKSQSKPVLN